MEKYNDKFIMKNLIIDLTMIDMMKKDIKMNV